MDKVIDTLVRLWLFDIEFFSQPWIYWWLCVPAACYLVFFFLKWAVLTAPLWLPLVIIIGAIKGDRK